MKFEMRHQAASRPQTRVTHESHARESRTCAACETNCSTHQLQGLGLHHRHPLRRDNCNGFQGWLTCPTSFLLLLFYCLLAAACLLLLLWPGLYIYGFISIQEGVHLSFNKMHLGMPVSEICVPGVSTIIDALFSDGTLPPNPVQVTWGSVLYLSQSTTVACDSWVFLTVDGVQFIT